MNKKGRFFTHGIILTVVIVITILAISSISTFISGIGKGEGQLEFHSFISEVRQSEYHVEQALRFIVWESTLGLAKGGGYFEESECGLLNGVALWNKLDQKCYPLAAEEFSLLFEEKLAGEKEELFTRNVKFLEFDYESYNPHNGETHAFLVEFPESIEVNFKEEYVAVISENPLIFRVLGGKMMQTKEFAFFFNIGYSIQEEYFVMQRQADALVHSCLGRFDLQDCLDEEKIETWHFSDCSEAEFNQEARKVAFCVESPSQSKVFTSENTLEDLQYHFALDFTSDVLDEEILVS